MIALYRPGASAIHRAPAGPKVLVFIAITLAITLSAHSAWMLPAAAVLVVAGYLIAGLGLGELAAQVVALRWLIVVMLVTQLVFLPALVALANTGRVVVVIALAALVTLTTRVPALLDATERTLAPLRRFGVNPAGVGLLLAMTITTIPVIAGLAGSIREAQRARGVPVRATTFVVPLLVLSLKHSDDLADALAARGVE
ncbi:energy-coupling factor transporter transmembrane component T family protein [Lacisediminihabitans profunda]|uniref:Energy-coupling factor transporter transmembrane protein EcfT n=1 Tax=Lacisediminihabitans profunda TaxID=2594790 RepID=A0A5C8UQ53_9MICO|nr:energy-coupling factor transporter transmembrane component T [Lacisediminihabitans profunda]TXN29504.1 energy-coupling factor transporter transmembrane protein EcfT [Lacisediminihabitans profunda]